MTSRAAGCLRCKEKLCSANEFYFTTLKHKCHLVFLNQIKSDLEPLLNWVVRNSVPQGFPGVQWGRGWQRLPGSWKSTSRHSEGSLQSRTSMPVTSVLRQPVLPPLQAFQGTLVSNAPGNHQSHFLAHCTHRRHGDCPQGWLLSLIYPRTSFQPVPLGRHSIFFLNKSLETQW